MIWVEFTASTHWRLKAAASGTRRSGTSGLGHFEPIRRTSQELDVVHGLIAARGRDVPEDAPNGFTDGAALRPVDDARMRACRAEPFVVDRQKVRIAGQHQPPLASGLGQQDLIVGLVQSQFLDRDDIHAGCHWRGASLASVFQPQMSQMDFMPPPHWRLKAAASGTSGLGHFETLRRTSQELDVVHGLIPVGGRDVLEDAPNGFTDGAALRPVGDARMRACRAEPFVVDRQEVRVAGQHQPPLASGLGQQDLIVGLV